MASYFTEVTFLVINMYLNNSYVIRLLTKLHISIFPFSKHDTRNCLKIRSIQRTSQQSCERNEKILNAVASTQTAQWCRDSQRIRKDSVTDISGEGAPRNIICFRVE
jgi:hypothetical protein